MIINVINSSNNNNNNSNNNNNNNNNNNANKNMFDITIENMNTNMVGRKRRKRDEVASGRSENRGISFHEFFHSLKEEMEHVRGTIK